MEIITDLQQANSLLNTYKGAALQFYLYSWSLKKMALRLKLPNNDQVIYIIGVSCEHFTGHLSINSSDLVITEELDSEFNEKTTIISDNSSGFKLITSGGFSLASGKEAEFGDSFENFLKEHK